MKRIMALIAEKAVAFDDTKAMALENTIFRVLIFPILCVGAIATFILRYFYLHEQALPVLTDSLVLLIVATLVFIFSETKLNEKLKETLLTCLVIFVMIFFEVRFFYLIGTCVFVLSFVFMVISLVKKRLTTTLLFALTGFLLVQYLYFSQNSLLTVPLSFLYFALQSSSFIIFTLVICVIHYIIKKQSLQIIAAGEKLEFTLNSVGDGVITTNTHRLIEFMNPIAESMTGWSQKEASGKPFEAVFQIVNEYSRQKAISPVQKVFSFERIVELENHTLLISKDKTERSIEYTAAPIMDNAKTIEGCVVVFKDFSKIKLRQREIEYLSYHDQLTGLYNRRFFEEELRRLDTNRNLPLSIVYADVNGLKMVNDAFGHEAGDGLLGQIADTFKAVCRSDDIVARVGGDEFIILLPKTGSYVADTVVSRIKEKLDLIVVNDIPVSISFGWDTKETEDQSTIDVLKTAEELMYRRKILYSCNKRNDIITSIHNTLFVKSPTENAHSRRVSHLCEVIGLAYKLSADELKDLSLAGYLHDIGKVAVDETVLNKPAVLSDSEWIKIKRHPEVGYRLLGATSEFVNLADCVLCHHERWDGLGYPKGLAGDAICWKARVISVADAYDTMINSSPYKNTLSKDEAIAEIKKNSGTQFDPEIVKVFVEVLLKIDHTKSTREAIAPAPSFN